MPSSSRALRADGEFGAGGPLPYDRALRDPSRTLYLRDVAERERAADSGRLDVERFLASADADDAALVAVLHGPVLDVGCGPGRLVHAAIMAGHLALGIDISPTAVRIAQEQGLPVLCRSVFGDLPAEGTWGVALLIDGNIGIGGDPAGLLRRCAELIRPDGSVIVETHPVTERDRVFEGVLVDDLERESSPFPWAEVGSTALHRYAEAAGLRVGRAWTSAGRSFAECVRT